MLSKIEDFLGRRIKDPLFQWYTSINLTEINSHNRILNIIQRSDPSCNYLILTFWLSLFWPDSDAMVSI